MQPSRRARDLTSPPSGNIPLRWRLAGMLHRLPEFHGRDRLGMMVLGHCPPPEGIHRGVFGPGLRFEVQYGDDGSFVDLFFLQYQDPALVPVLEECLPEGGTFFDVGANIGIYTGWASKLVGDAGSVHAFEPIPSTREALARFVALNKLRNVRIVPLAVGEGKGSLTIHTVEKSSGLASAIPRQGALGQVSVSMTSLDAYAAQAPSPRLIKIDVEGYEFHVIRGARKLLSRPEAPAILFESQGEHLERSGVCIEEIGRWLDREAGYRLFSLLPSGLRCLPAGAKEPFSANSLALDPDRHAEIIQRLERRRFRRNQTC